MERARPLLIVAVVGLVLLPSSAWAGGRGQRGGVVVVSPRGRVVVASPSPVVVRPGPRIFVAPTPSVVTTIVPRHRFFVPRQHFFPKFGAPAIVTGPFFPVVVSAPPVIVSAPPIVYAQPPPVVYAQPPVVSVAPAPPPIPTVIEHPTGWYQLRGDGVTTPYVWVWIPKPPPPPPSEAPAGVPPEPPSKAPPADSSSMPSAQPRSSASPGEIYRWTDEEGEAHWTDRLNNIPERYRANAQRWS